MSEKCQHNNDEFVFSKGSPVAYRFFTPNAVLSFASLITIFFDNFAVEFPLGVFRC